VTRIKQLEWQKSHAWARPDDATIYLWRLDLFTNQRLHLLNEKEIARYKSIQHESQARRFLNARGQLKALLAGYLDAEPQEIQIETETGGKPMLSDPANPLQFNLSHCDDLALVAVSKNMKVGVDVEIIRQRRGMTKVFKRYFDSEAKVTEISPQLFFECWTTMEARQKCLGRGIFGEKVLVGEVGSLSMIIAPDVIASVAWDNPAAIPPISCFDYAADA
jgi:4'-phosphopantetheinyl transferase